MCSSLNTNAHKHTYLFVYSPSASHKFFVLASKCELREWVWSWFGRTSKFNSLFDVLRFIINHFELYRKLYIFNSFSARKGIFDAAAALRLLHTSLFLVFFLSLQASLILMCLLCHLVQRLILHVQAETLHPIVWQHFIWYKSQQLKRSLYQMKILRALYIICVHLRMLLHLYFDFCLCRLAIWLFCCWKSCKWLMNLSGNSRVSYMHVYVGFSRIFANER